MAQSKNISQNSRIAQEKLIAAIEGVTVELAALQKRGMALKRKMLAVADKAKIKKIGRDITKL